MKPIVVSLGLTLLAAPLSAAPPFPKITLVYTTAETSSSAEVVWNTNVASDSLLRYSTINPIPADAPSVYRAAQVTYHDFELTGLSPATLYYFEVKSCARRRCATATGSFDTYPICPDEVAPVSGGWQQEVTPNVGGSTAITNQLLAVDAISENDVWAVGWAQQPNGPPYVRRTLTEHFDGTSWSIVPSPNSGSNYFNVLQAVSGTSSSDVWAVGVTHNGTLPSRTLIEHWNGTQWSIVPSPSPGLQLNELRGIVALSPTNAWAVGYREATGETEATLDPLILRWNGQAWNQVPSPSIGAGANQLSGIGAISANDIWAVGNGGGGPLALHWNGSAWSVVPVTRDAGLGSERLVSVSGAAGNDVWAVGDGHGVFNPGQSFATLRHWNGTYWTQKVCYASSLSNPPPDYEGGGPSAYYTGVSARATNDVWAVGVSGSGPLIRHWDGQAWTTVIHPRAYPNSAVLRGVTTTTGGSAWAAGGEYVMESDYTEQTLIDRYSP